MEEENDDEDAFLEGTLNIVTFNKIILNTLGICEMEIN